jgi:outer membrane lipoprotein-sorting protein
MKIHFFLFMTLCFANICIVDIKRGHEIYKQLCVNCHGPNLDGGIGPSLVDSYWKNGDSYDAVYRSIAKGINGTEMIAYELVYPEKDLQSLTEFILDKQEGNRQTLRSTYARDYFDGKRLRPDLFDSIESNSQTRLPENFYYVGRMFDGVLRGQSKLFVKTPGKYRLNVNGKGRTSIWVNGKEVHYSNDKKNKDTYFNNEFELSVGIHDLEILHEEPTSHSMRFGVRLQKLNGKHWMLTGKSLEGNIPKIVRAGQEAKVIRKWIQDLPPRTLLLLLPNKVLLAYDAESGEIIKGWESAYLNQTPSLDSRSQKQSEISGNEIENASRTVVNGEKFNLLHYETSGDSVKIATLVDGKSHTFTISPAGTNSYSLTF